MRQTLAERFANLVAIPSTDDGCWRWIGATDRGGYGVMWKDAKNRAAKAHRVSYELFVGPIPPGYPLDHLCRRRDCVNPAHLEPVTDRENVVRGESIVAQNMRKTHCVTGHPLSGENLRLSMRGGSVRRGCRECRREQRRAFIRTEQGRAWNAAKQRRQRSRRRQAA